MSFFYDEEIETLPSLFDDWMNETDHEEKKRLFKLLKSDELYDRHEIRRALNNLIKLSDLGAFIELNIQGFEKGYTLNLSEAIIPKDFLKLSDNYSPITVQLLSLIHI